MLSFKELIDSCILENLHPELQSVIKQGQTKYNTKQSQIAKKIRDLSKRGESTGIEGNMPKGSSRAYLKHDEPHHTMVDGKPAALETGTKVAIHAALDKHHNKAEYDGHTLGELQNKAEGGDHWVNDTYRHLVHSDDGKSLTSNTDRGIFPPLIDHDHDSHKWSHVGHARDIKAGEFNKLTKSPDHPKGISHKDFVESMDRFHNRNNGKYWGGSVAHEHHLDHVDSHPLVQKFQDYHGNTGHPTSDYSQKKNMGVWKHPHTGEEHIVARDHGFDTDVAKAYHHARTTSRVF